MIYYAPKLEQGPDESGWKEKKMKEGLYIACDTETYYEKGKYSVSGKNGLTMRQYTDDKRFNCYLVSFAIKSDDAEKFGIDVAGWEDFEYKSPSTGETVSLKAVAKHPSEIDWIQFDGATLVQHNANFDCEVLRRLMKDGKVPKFEHKVVDTADMIAYLGIRRSLQAGMKFVFGTEVSKKVRSDMDGKRVEQLSPSEREALYRYGTDDAIHCFMLWLECGHKWPYVERRMSELNRESNMRGILTDVDLVESGLDRLRRIYSDGASKLPWMMAENPEDRYPASSCPALAKWLEAHGYEIPKSFNKNGNDFMDWKKVLDKEKDAELLSILDARIAVTGTQSHIARLETMLQQVDEDGRLHPGFVYFGAHTGRFTAGVAGDREEGKKSSDDPKNLNLLNMAKKPVYGVDLRAMYVAGPGRKMVICDYSQVEARALLWLADDDEMCKALMYDKSKGEKEPNLYQLTAVKMNWCKPEDDIKHEQPTTYQMAKQCVLGLGYSMAAFTFLLRLEACGIVIPSVPENEWTDDDLRGCDFIFRKQAFLDPKDPSDKYRCGQFMYVRRIVEQWRNANWRIAGRIDPETGFRSGGFWREQQATLVRAAQTRSPRFWVEMPSGRKKTYHEPVVCMKDGSMGERGSRYYMARPVQGGRSVILNGGKLTENLVQAFCRDILVNSIVEIADKHPNWEYLWNVYDEVVFSVPDDEAEFALKEIGDIMCHGDNIAPWTKGLPLGVEGCIADHYTK